MPKKKEQEIPPSDSSSIKITEDTFPVGVPSANNYSFIFPMGESAIVDKTEHTFFAGDIKTEVIVGMNKSCGQAIPTYVPCEQRYPNPHTKPKLAIPPKIQKRNEYGLIDGVNYIFNEDGRVDWRKMIPSEYLYINPQILTDPKRRERFEKKYEKAADQVSIDEIDDVDLVILLAGIKYLADLRGYLDVSYRPITCSSDYSATVCKIVWRSNYETEGRELSFESTAGASMLNTDSFGKKYLMEMAENRAFNRAVRNFLKINIVSQQEIVKDGQKSEDEDDGVVTPFTTLKRAMADKGVTFERVKTKLIDEKVEGAEGFNSVNDIPKSKIMSLVSRIRGMKNKE